MCCRHCHRKLLVVALTVADSRLPSKRSYHSFSSTKPLLVLDMLLIKKQAGALVVLVTTLLGTALAVPKYEPSKWNQAYKLSIWNVTSDQTDAPLLLKQLPFDTVCSRKDFDLDPEAALLDSCYEQQQPNGTWSYWVKKSGDLRDDSNCYCYALDVHKGGFCVPGTSNGTDQLLQERVTCERVTAAVVADGARRISREQALGGQPSVGHYIAMLARNMSCNPYHCWEDDFHAVRKDADGTWSGKMSVGPVTKRDMFGNVIEDPQNSILSGHYDEFCGYFHVVPSNMTIGVPEPEQSLQDVMKELSRDGMLAMAQPLRYSPRVDDALDKESRRMEEEDIVHYNERVGKQQKSTDGVYVSSLGRKMLHSGL